MSRSTAVAASGAGDAEMAKLHVLKQALYDRCKDIAAENDMFSQDELLKLDVIPNRDAALLMRVIQLLSNDKLFITMRETSGNVLWKWRDAQEADKYKQCSTDEQVLVYSMIDDAGGDGIWSQTLQKRLNMHDSVMKNALKQLQSKGLIAPFKNVEHPNKKMYIKASIRPSDRATGGPWYTDQNFDDAFIEELQRVVFDFIKRESSYASRRGSTSGATTNSRPVDPKKGVVRGSIDKGKKRTAGEMDQPVAKPQPAPKKEATLLPLPAGYKGYPTVRDIARFLSSSGITSNTILSEEDVRKLIDVLVWDNLIEPVKVAGKIGYRVSRVAKQSTEQWAGREDLSGPELHVSPFTEAPCGRCPVFDLCEEGGPVGPSNCEYFKTWLGIDL